MQEVVLAFECSIESVAATLCMGMSSVSSAGGLSETMASFSSRQRRIRTAARLVAYLES